jgi:cyclophilin family peptidyl-prolyl cis-trans isomerase/HEAT repeat protein
VKAIAAAATVVVVLHAQARPPQAPPPLVVQTPAGAEPLAVLNAERAWSGADAFWTLINDRNSTEDVRRYAVRALGRLEDPSQVRPLLALRPVPFDAVAQSLYGFDPVRDPQLVSDVASAMKQTVQGGQASTADERMPRAAALARAMSHVAYATDAQVGDMESLLADALAEAGTSVKFAGSYVACAEGLEALARVNTKHVHYDARTIAVLAKVAAGDTANGTLAAGRLYAFLALVNARALTPDVERKALNDDDWSVRRAAAAVLAGSGGGLDDETTTIEIMSALDDKNAHVRYEAVKAWGRRRAAGNGCEPLLTALQDDDQAVALEAIDLLGDRCRDREDITTRLEAEATVPPAVGPWQRQTHAFVALARRAPGRSALAMGAFAMHQLWWVRMYAAYAAGGAKDLARLERLAADDNDNVREAALTHLRALDPARAEAAILADLERTDTQLIRTAAGILKELPAAPSYVKPLVASLDRTTKLHSMTSRDGRMALLDAIEHHARPDDHTLILPWLKDFDPVVAERAAAVIFHLSGRTLKPEPAALPHVPTQPFANLQLCATLDMANGHPIRLRMRPDLAPIAVEQFVKLATIDRYYNGLTFHRIVPNFVIQGGSPNANEYSGNTEYMRDEIAGSNVRGTVGLSTRGRNTGDAQFFINLVDNPRLDGNYTVFARVTNMDEADRIQEGDVMRSITMSSCR